MRNAIQEYLDLSDNEKKSLWDNAIFVFDTNVFLNLYRYTAKTRELLFLAFESLKERLWMPNHVAHEFMKNRCNIIWESNNHYDTLKKEGEKFVDLCRTELNLDSNDRDLAEFKGQIEKWIEAARNKNIEVFSPSGDKILSKILDLYDGKVGSDFSEEEKKEIELEGKERYASMVPPGYKDSDKKRGTNLNNTYGDLMVWKQIMNFASNAKADIILVTNDQKEDWWEILHGQTIGPRIELKKEFAERTSQKFHMYSMKNFITLFDTGRNVTVDREAIDEIEFFSKIIHHKSSKKELRSYYSSLGSDNEAKAAKIRFEIMRLENKNRKRRNAVEQNREKYVSSDMPSSVQEIIANNLANIDKDIVRIESLKVKLCQYDN